MTREESLADGVVRCIDLFTGLQDELEALVKKYFDRVKDMAFIEIGAGGTDLKNKEYAPNILTSRMIGYLNVLSAITRPVNHDCAHFDCMLHDVLSKLEGSEHYERAMQAWKDRHK